MAIQNNDLRTYAKLGIEREIERLKSVLDALNGVKPPKLAVNSRRTSTGWTPAKRKRHAKMMRERWAEKRKGA